jgi:ornithine cyclodeaminase/alanine dehydrogenase-like protein (mu-crystallin family)
MIHISEEQVRAALPMARALELVEQSFVRLDGRRALNHPRRRLVLENSGVLHYMAAGDHEDRLLAAKLYVSNPRAKARFVVLLFDAEQASLLAMLDAESLGQIRTGAATGIATRCLARPEASILGMIGSGFQAETQLEAVAAVRSLRQVRVYSRSPENRNSFARRMSERLGLHIEAVDTAEQAVRECDIVVTVTNARQPVLEGAWLAAGCHVNAAGTNQPNRQEIDTEAVARSALVAVDSIEQAKAEAGDLIAAVAKGELDWSRVLELPAIVSGRIPGRRTPGDITLFESQGIAAEDLAVAAHVYRAVAG